MSFFFFFNDTATTEIYTLSLHDALPISLALLDRRDVERQFQRFGDDRPRGGFVLDLRLLAVELVQPRLERLAVLLEVGLDGPVLLRHELADLLLALADQAQRHRLDPSRGQAGLDALPQERRRLVPHQPV